jgi:NTP pyrophosphatase (non-canonical NTP hydrolase)
LSQNRQIRATQFAQKHNLHHTAGVHMLDALNGPGEVAKAILPDTDYGRRPLQVTPERSQELGDVLYALCLLASAVEVDLETVVTAAPGKDQERWQEKGHAGSSRQRKT